MSVIPYLAHQPLLDDSVFVAPSAWVIGQVEMSEESSIFFGAVARGDIQPIKIGRGSNIQDNAVLHTSRGRQALLIGTNVTVGHAAILHGCTVQGSAIIGMGSTILDDAVIEENVIIGANSLVTEGKRIPAGSLALGAPARVVRQLTAAEIEEIQASARSYQSKAREFRAYFASLAGIRPQ